MTTKSKVAIMSVFFVVSLGSAQKKSPAKKSVVDPCAKAETQFEMNQCTAERYRRSDKRLNEVYDRISNSLQKDLQFAQTRKDENQVKYNTTILDNLKSAQRAWLVYRDLHCSAAKQIYEGGTIAPTIHAGCLQQVTDHRIKELRDTYESDL